MHRLILFNVLLFLIPVMLEAQGTTPLSKLLWSRVNACYSNFEDMDGDGELDFLKVDDSRNGYLQISGGWPTCGCECTSTVGAYKDANGKYTLLQLDEYNCDWILEVSSNREMEDILPENFGINTFLAEEVNSNLLHPAFVLDIDIPRIGTDTKASLKLIPLGLFSEGNQAITYGYRERGGNGAFHDLVGINRIIRGIKNENSLQLLLDGKFKQLSSEDKKLLEKEMGEGPLKFDSLQEFSKYLIHLHEVYQLYSKLTFTEFTLGWNREKARFYIKNKSGKPQDFTFKEFILNSDYWGLVC